MRHAHRWGLFDAPSRSCWQLEPLKKERPSGHAIAGIPTVSVWPNPRRNACLMRFGRSMAVSMAFVLSSIWERYDNMYLRCQTVSTLHEEYSKIYAIHIYTVFDEMNTCNKVYMNLIHLILTGDLWPPLTIHPLIKGLTKKCSKTLHLKISPLQLQSFFCSQQLKEKPRCDPFRLWDESWQLAWLGISGAIMDYKYWLTGLKMT